MLFYFIALILTAHRRLTHKNSREHGHKPFSVQLRHQLNAPLLKIAIHKAPTASSFFG